MSYRSWCPSCVRTKGRGDYHKQVYDKRPVIQVDHAFLVDKVETTTEGATTSTVTQPKVTVLTACDVTTGMVLAAVVKVRGVDDRAVNELRRFRI